MVFESTILNQREIALGTHEVTFKRPADFTFRAGQHMQVAVQELLYSDSKGGSRLFSIASSPNNLEELRVIFRLSGSGFKETLRSLSIGTIVKLEQASGSFLLPQKLTRPHVFIAGGVGISPFMSYLNKNTQDTLDQSITLYYGNQNPQSAAYIRELTLMDTQQKNFSLEEVYKRPVKELFLKIAARHVEAIWWIVGPPPMVALTVDGLLAGGVPMEQIHTESFEGY